MTFINVTAPRLRRVAKIVVDHGRTALGAEIVMERIRILESGVASVVHAGRTLPFATSDAALHPGWVIEISRSMGLVLPSLKEIPPSLSLLM